MQLLLTAALPHYIEDQVISRNFILMSTIFYYYYLLLLY